MITRYTSADMYGAQSYCGLSTDIKPVGCPANSTFYELDTKKMYYWNREGYDDNGGAWLEFGEPVPLPYFDKASVQDYLYTLDYDRIDYWFADKWLREHDTSFFGACSAVRNGNWYGRNFDWFYSDLSEFIVRVQPTDGTYASVGMAGSITGITDAFVDSGEKAEWYKIIPFHMQDGINEHGLVCSTNVVPTDFGKNLAEPKKEKMCSICSIALVRYILDHFQTAEEAVNYIRDYVQVWFPKQIHDMSYEQQYMIADSEKTYLLDFRDNEAVFEDISDKPYMTNFHLLGVQFNDDGTVNTPESDGDPVEDNHVTPHGSGLERYNAIVAGYDTADTKDGMRDLIESLYYTKSYSTSDETSEPFWYSECVGGDIYCNSPLSAFTDIVDAMGQLYLDRSRGNADTWQTVHSVVYDIDGKSLTVICQENGNEINQDL